MVESSIGMQLGLDYDRRSPESRVWSHGSPESRESGVKLQLGISSNVCDCSCTASLSRHVSPNLKNDNERGLKVRAKRDKGSPKGVRESIT